MKMQTLLYLLKNDNKYAKDKKGCKVRDHSHYTGEYRGVGNSIYSVPKEICIAFHNSSLTKEEKEFDGQFIYLGENTEKYITFSVTIKQLVIRIITIIIRVIRFIVVTKVIRIDKKRKEITKVIF